MIGLIGSLTLVLAACGAGLYWLQYDRLLREFDHKLDRHTMYGLRAFRQRRPRGDTQRTTSPDATRETTREATGQTDASPGDQPEPDAALTTRSDPGAEPELRDGLVFLAVWTEGQAEPDRMLPTDLELGPAFPPVLAEGDNFDRRTLDLPDGRQVRVAIRRLPSWTRWRSRQRRIQQAREREAREQQAREQEAREDSVQDGPDAHATQDTSSDAPPAATQQDEPREGDEPPQRPSRMIISAADLAPLHADLRDWMLILIGGGAGAELLVIAVVLLAVGRGLRPLRALERDVADIDDRDFAGRLHEAGLPGELRPLVAQLNSLLERVERAFQREREFTSNAAHEFMTPLAAIRTQIEVALRRDRPANDYRATLEESLDSARSLHRMVDLLLDLCRLERTSVKLHAESFDIAEAVRSTLDQVSEAYRDRGCTWRPDLPDVVTFTSDREVVQRILSNLASNAWEYADESSEIALSLTGPLKGDDGDALVRLTCCNQASSLTADDVARMGDRFWRKDTARSDSQHRGLGLSIVLRCVSVLGGAYHAGLEGGRLTVTIELPAMPDASDVAAAGDPRGPHQ